MTLCEVRKTLRKLLSESPNQFVRQTPALDADVLICHFAGITKTYLLTHDDEQITPFLAEDLSVACGQRLSGLPVAYIINEKEFYGRPFYVDQAVLIPKPDTELLVELAVTEARRMSEKPAGPSQQETLSKASLPSQQGALSKAPLRIADICTGSGCIAVSLLMELAGGAALKADGGLGGGSGCGLEITATDLSRDALRVAGKNVEKLVPDALRGCISLLEGDLCAPLDAAAAAESASGTRAGQLFDIIVSNPPYVPAAVTDELLSDGRGEPRLALDGDTDAALKAGAGLVCDAALNADAGLVCDAAAESAPCSESTPRSSDGLAIIRRLGPQVYAHLAPGGAFFLETGEYNAEAAAAYLETCGFTDVHIHRDLSGQLRVTEAHRPR